MSSVPSPRPWFLGPLALAVLLTLSAVVFTVATMNEIRTARSSLAALTAGYADQVGRVVVESQRYALTVFSAWEDKVGNHLVALAVLADQLERAGEAYPARLDSIAVANDLACFTVRRADGRVVAGSVRAPGAEGEAVCWGDLRADGVDSLRAGEAVVLRAPVEGTGGYRLIAVLKRRDGGIVCAGLNAAVMSAARRQIGPGRLLQTLGEHSGTAYLAMQDTIGIVAATSGVDRLSSIEGDDMLRRVLATGQPESRELKYRDREVLEQITRLDVEGNPVSLLRTAVDLSEVRRRERDIAWSIVLHTLLLVGTLVAGTALVMASRRLVATQAAWARARREVTALEEERARHERSVALGELASGVAHEIRNPLNAIHMIAQRLGREFTPTIGTQEYGRLTDAVRQEVGRINGIVEQFLRFARPPQPQPRSTDITALVNELVEVVRGRFEARGVVLTARVSGHIVAVVDPDLLRQALHNLLDNALDACARGASVEVHAAAGAQLHLAVTDTGSGIPADQLRRIFNLYHTTKPGGTGIGLALVDQIVSLHGGAIRVESVLGQGSVFNLELPLTPATEEPS
jgi:signal transduction histidine kinase